eukprot:277608-Rhodomonas_salina.2
MLCPEPTQRVCFQEDLRYAYSKLHVWSLHEYRFHKTPTSRTLSNAANNGCSPTGVGICGRQVVYVDADALLYYCLDDLFSTAAPFAAGTFPISNKFEKLDPSDNRFKINFESLGFGTWCARPCSLAGPRTCARGQRLTCPRARNARDLGARRVFTAKPSEETYARLLREAAYTGSFDGSDGGLLYNLWPDRYLMPPYVTPRQNSLRCPLHALSHVLCRCQ